jgi:primosomal protein N' (replication factor Y) (superfamily II helicase)
MNAPESPLTGQIAVLIPNSMGGPYDYRVSAGESVARGDFVRVPFGKRDVMGVVWGTGLADLPEAKIKTILGRMDVAPLPAAMVDFIAFVAAYTLSDAGAVLKLSLPVDVEKKATSTRGKPIGGDKPDPDHRGVTLTSDQQDAARLISAGITQGGYKTFVLDGVTGAGKTEVYFEAVAEAIRQGRQVLILQPEIALTTSFVERFKKRFGQEPALWHSGITPVQRRKTWRGIVDGSIKVVAGARSALMLPYPKLGLIVIDEEHDVAYKQDEGVMYHARDMAVARAHQGGFPIVLASATPSLETCVNVWSGRYTHVVLPDRFGNAVLPDVHLIDLREDKPERGSFIAPTLYNAMAETLARKEQVLLFLNRRGYAPLTLCRACGFRIMCPRCTAWMVAHRRTGRLHCHHCGYETKQPTACPSCHTEDSLVACGPGVERIAEEAREKFPEAKCLVLSSDLAEHPAELQAALQSIVNGEIDIVIGTQLIAKGHHFPGLTLVGVVDGDLGLAGGDLRAAERTFQLLQQVAGRAGRESKRGVVYLQTFMPDNKVMQALKAGARDPFLKLEAAERQQALMPPFARLVGIIVSGTDETATRDVAQEIARAAPIIPGMTVWGPAEAPLFKIRGKTRFRLLVQAERTIALQKTVKDWVGHVRIPSKVSVRLDVDPQNFL